MTLIELVYKTVIRPIVFARSKNDAERAHEWGLSQLRWVQQDKSALNLLESALGFDHLILHSRPSAMGGLHFPNPLGLAAGYDKYCEVYHAALPACGWGFAEVGGITPLPQKGSPRPRMLRAYGTQALWNQMGFNNPGMDAAHASLISYAPPPIPIGLNVGKGKDTPVEDAASDYVKVVTRLAHTVDFITLNVSSPNTANLRQLQNAEYLLNILRSSQAALSRLGLRTPLGIKISPDETDEQIADIVSAALEGGANFLIVSNTTIRRDRVDPQWGFPADRGGVSGAPLASAAKRILQDVYMQTQGRITLIGVGGIANADDLYQRIRMGASLCQAYTAWPYEGPDFAKRTLKGLVKRLKSDGFKHVSEAVGVGV